MLPKWIEDMKWSSKRSYEANEDALDSTKLIRALTVAYEALESYKRTSLNPERAMNALAQIEALGASPDQNGSIEQMGEKK